MTEKTKSQAMWIADILSKVVLFVLTGLVGWTASTTQDLEVEVSVLSERVQVAVSRLSLVDDIRTRITKLEAGCARPEDLAALRETLEARLRAMEGKLPKSFPPKATQAELDRHEAMIEKMDERIHALERQ
ncbi:MAG: hypothetical protein GY820_39315 [Gammaproteobacteria bacterium]|nr:hypothetical protein [Gammaproteobacteria bacterium]